MTCTKCDNGCSCGASCSCASDCACASCSKKSATTMAQGLESGMPSATGGCTSCTATTCSCGADCKCGANCACSSCPGGQSARAEVQ